MQELEAEEIINRRSKQRANYRHYGVDKRAGPNEEDLSLQQTMDWKVVLPDVEETMCC